MSPELCPELYYVPGIVHCGRGERGLRLDQPVEVTRDQPVDGEDDDFAARDIYGLDAARSSRMSPLRNMGAGSRLSAFSKGGRRSVDNQYTVPGKTAVRKRRMSAYYDYIVSLARRLSALERPKALDYGCGAGEIVRRALDAGIDCYGVDVFYGGGSLKQAAADTGLLGKRIFFVMEDGCIPMETEGFDIVFANQVFEHIDDFARPLSEIDRVLKADGIFINVFPSAQVWREGHIGIPFAHWYPKGTTVSRLYYVLLLRHLGFGHHKGDKTCRQWSVDALTWGSTTGRSTSQGGRSTNRSPSASPSNGSTTTTWRIASRTIRGSAPWPAWREPRWAVASWPLPPPGWRATSTCSGRKAGACEIDFKSWYVEQSDIVATRAVRYLFSKAISKNEASSIPLKSDYG